MKIKTTQEIMKLAKQLKKNGKIIVTTNGAFDILHIGHLRYLRKAKQLGDVLIVLLNSDSSVRKFKGANRPFNGEQDRANYLAELDFVDYVVVFKNDTPLSVLKFIKPDFHVKGGSFIPKRIEAERKLLQSWGGNHIHFEMEGDYSTSNIVSKVLDRKSNSKYSQLDVSKLRTIPISKRKNLVKIKDFSKGIPKAGSVSKLIESFGEISHRTDGASNLKYLIDAVLAAKNKKKAITWAIGPHVVKHGMNPIIIKLMEHDFISCAAMNGAGAIHDSEIALIGETSEEMSDGIYDGTFGMAKETGDFLNEAAKRAYEEGLGFGESIGKSLWEMKAPYAKHSIIANAYKKGIPSTIHVAMGTDIVHMHPNMDGAATGYASYNDFKILAGVMQKLGGGGVHINIASSVVLPEVFLKTLTMAQNIKGGFDNFTTANFDHLSEYRPLMNVCKRPTKGLGKGYEIIGRIEIMIPLLAKALMDRK